MIAVRLNRAGFTPALFGLWDDERCAMSLCCLDLRTTDAAWNLAAEQYVFDSMPRDRSYFMLWQNQNAVVIGKYQNTYAEINADYVRRRQIQVVRRLSGGGAVYHDLGNLNFSFIADAGPLGRLDLTAFCRPVIRTLRALGVPAELNGRNDMTIDGKKFSGNSQYMRQGRVLHHGTLLFDSDLDTVGLALHADADKLHSKGVASVRSRVVNLRPYLDPPLSLEKFRAQLLENIRRESSGELYEWNEADLAAIEDIRRRRYACWEWNYGRSPACSMEKKRRFEGCGTVSAFFSLEGELIRELHFFGDFFSTVDPEALAARLIGLRLKEEDLRSALSGLDPEVYISGMTVQNLIELLLY